MTLITGERRGVPTLGGSPMAVALHAVGALVVLVQAAHPVAGEPAGRALGGGGAWWAAVPSRAQGQGAIQVNFVL